jgi:shikimate dehydrogenase
VITGRTAIYGVIGHPVDHSRSPQMHNAAFSRLGLDGVYVALPVAPGTVPEALRGAHALGLKGLNVTVPHKQEALRCSVAADEVARQVGAANTLRRTDAGWEAFNTDALAVRELLKEAGLPRGARVLLLGAGGAARAAAWALFELECELTVMARRPEAAEQMVRTMTRRSGKAPRILNMADLAREALAADAVVNCTLVGFHGGQPSFPGLAFRPGQLAAEFVYGETAFGAAALEGGAQLVTGENLLVRQGALAFTLWTGHPAPAGEMARAVGAHPGSKR